MISCSITNITTLSSNNEYIYHLSVYVLILNLSYVKSYQKNMFKVVIQNKHQEQRIIHIKAKVELRKIP